uniref:Uncharacterized protein n=1 Tax=Hyaloperonospora arabidopsidis (strain Emoy2) TaxID=559515 RepID=M4BGU4_HYAAE
MVTPRAPGHRRRVRDSIEDDEDDKLLDAMLVQIGIPVNNHQSTPSSAAVNVIELVTPPRDLSPPAKKRQKTQSNSRSIVDLTTSPSLLKSPNGYTNSTIVIIDAAREEEKIEKNEKNEQQQDETPYSYSPLAESFESLSSCEGTNSCLVSSSPEFWCLSSLEGSPLGRSHQVGGQERNNAKARARQVRRLSGSLEQLRVETSTGSSESSRNESEQETASAVMATRTIAAAATIAAAEGSGAGTVPASSAGSEQTRVVSSRPRAASRARRDGPADVGTVMVMLQMEKSLDSSVMGQSIRHALQSHVYNGKPVPYTIATPLDCSLPGVIRWEGRHGDILHCSCAIYYEAKVFLEDLQQKSYKEVVAAVQYLQALVPKNQQLTCQSRRAKEQQKVSNFFVIVEGMDRALIEHKKQQKKRKASSSATTIISDGSPMITFADLHEVALQLFMDVGAHTKFTCDLDDTVNYIALLTRELVIASSRASLSEEYLDAVPRYNSFRVTRTGATTSACANAWLRMLQVIPGVSEDKAQCLLDYFPTFDSLMQAYQDPNATLAQKQDLVADKMRDARIQRALSKRIYSVFCEENPDALV